MTEIRRGNLSEYWQIIDFIDFVFSKNSVPHHFPEMYPNLYRTTDESMNNLLNLWEDGVIKCSVLTYPRTVSVGGESLDVTGIGSVATHPRERGRGFMQKVLGKAIEEMREKGVHLSNLGGDRKRYNHFGYEVTGSQLNAQINANNVRRFRPDFNADSIRFTEFDMNDAQTMKRSMELYEKQAVHYLYDEADFYLRMINASSRAFSVSKDGEYIGFAALAGGRFRELCLTDDKYFADVMSAAALKNGSASCSLGEWKLPSLREFCDNGGNYSLCDNGFWLVMRWKEVLDAFVRFKDSYAAVPEGELVVDIKGEGRYKIEKGGVTETTAKADIEVTSLQAVRLFFGYTLEEFTYALPAEKRVFAKSLLPLPLTWFNTEAV
ncbi:MAG: GNAT family N-acetyltransferase [Clostridia bacterium]|nr:GNAT family N-acetyltransferase [Clostridia bacterium]